MSKYLRARGKPLIERVLIPSLSIIYPPYSETSRKKDFFLYFFPFRLDEIKVGGDSCLSRHFANKKCKMQTSIKQSVLPPYHNKFSQTVISSSIHHLLSFFQKKKIGKIRVEELKKGRPCHLTWVVSRRKQDKRQGRRDDRVPVS